MLEKKQAKIFELQNLIAQYKENKNGVQNRTPFFYAVKKDFVFLIRNAVRRWDSAAPLSMPDKSRIQSLSLRKSPERG